MRQDKAWGPKGSARRAIFIDRDGVINHKLPEDRYVSDVSEFRLINGVRRALTILRGKGFALVVVTNQRGIGRGLMTEQDLARVHRFMGDEFARAGLSLDGVYHCPHDKTEGCGCRKPKPGMLLRAMDDLGIGRDGSFMVGDSVSDIIAGRDAGVTTVRIGPAEATEADFTFPSLLDFARFIEKGV